MTTAALSATKIADAIEKFDAQADCLFAWIEGMREDDLAATPIPGKMSMRRLVIHMMDSDAVGLDRFKRVIAGKGEASYATANRPPLLLGYEETSFMEELSEDLDLETVARAFSDGRRLMAARLRALPESAFGRVGIHSETGVKTLADLLTGYTWHVDYHAEFASEKRVALGHAALA